MVLLAGAAQRFWGGAGIVWAVGTAVIVLLVGAAQSIPKVFKIGG